MPRKTVHSREQDCCKSMQGSSYSSFGGLHMHLQSQSWNHMEVVRLPTTVACIHHFGAECKWFWSSATKSSCLAVLRVSTNAFRLRNPHASFFLFPFFSV